MKKSKSSKQKRKLKPLSIVRWALMILMIASLFTFVHLDSVESNMFNLGYYQSLFEKNEVYPVWDKDGYSKEGVDDIAVEVMTFLKGKGELSELFTEEEKTHMEDVKSLVKDGRTLYFSSLILFFVLLIPFYIISKKQKKIPTDFSIITLTTAVLLIISLFMPLFSKFDMAFMRFHEIFFAGNYIFPKTYSLIKLFPFPFFKSITKRILLHTLIKSIVLVIVGFLPIIFKLQEKQIKLGRMDALKFGGKKK